MQRTIAAMLVVVLMLGTVLIVGCGGGGGTEGTTTGTFTCKVDGVAFTGTYKFCREKNNQLQIIAVSADEMRYMQLVLALPVTAPVTRNLVSFAGANWALWDSNSDTIGTEYGTTPVGGGSGTVTITQYDGNRCVGTFAFTADNANNTVTVTVTEGAFDVYTGGLSGW